MLCQPEQRCYIYLNAALQHTARTVRSVVKNLLFVPEYRCHTFSAVGLKIAKQVVESVVIQSRIGRSLGNTWDTSKFESNDASPQAGSHEYGSRHRFPDSPWQ